MTPSIPTVIKVGFAPVELESFKLKAEGACRYQGERSFAEILFSSESVITVLDGHAAPLTKDYKFYCLLEEG